MDDIEHRIWYLYYPTATGGPTQSIPLMVWESVAIPWSMITEQAFAAYWRLKHKM